MKAATAVDSLPCLAICKNDGNIGGNCGFSMNEIMAGLLFAGVPLSFPHSACKLNLYLLDLFDFLTTLSQDL
jgi:hypothetical protein